MDSACNYLKYHKSETTELIYSFHFFFFFFYIIPCLVLHKDKRRNVSKEREER